MKDRRKEVIGEGKHVSERKREKTDLNIIG